MNKIPKYISKKDFCRAAGISRPTLDKWLAGGSVLPAIRQAIQQGIKKTKEMKKLEKLEELYDIDVVLYSGTFRVQPTENSPWITCDVANFLATLEGKQIDFFSMAGPGLVVVGEYHYELGKWWRDTALTGDLDMPIIEYLAAQANPNAESRAQKNQL